MKKAFTLLELMIAIAVLVTLMGLVFRINIAGADNKKRIETVMRMQKLENCISGYYAAFGSYPPVKLHASRNYKLRVKNGVQSADGNENSDLWSWNKIGDEAEKDAWAQVKEACRAQPADCAFPFPDYMKEYVKFVSDELKARIEAGKWKDLHKDQKEKILAGFDYGISNLGNFDKTAIDWYDIRLFKFGLMSYLLPRYLVMMQNSTVVYGDYLQWTANNATPYNALDGTELDWKNLRDNVYGGQEGRINTENKDYHSVANIPSQAICARWLPNLEKICDANPPPRDPMKPHIKDNKIVIMGINIWSGKTSGISENNPYLDIYAPGGSDDVAYQYVLDSVTVKDGWGNDFYYYSPAPHQRYILWSAGDNGRTFPQWVDRSQLGNKANECIGKWIQDDIIHLSN